MKESIYISFKKKQEEEHLEFMKKQREELNLAMQNKAFAYEALYYEMLNHEYPINWEGDYDVLACFGRIKYNEEYDASDYMEQLGFSDEIKSQFYKAERDVRQAYDW